MKGYVVFNADIAAKLILVGEALINVRADIKDSERMVYIFRNTKTIQRNIKLILKS